MSSLRERARVANTLVCLLKGLEGRKTIIELRDEKSVVGVVESVTASMNLTLTEATLTMVDGSTQEFKDFFVKGTRVRYIHIPDFISMHRTIERELNVIRGVRHYTEQRIKRPRPSKKERKAIQKALLDRKVQELRDKVSAEKSGAASVSEQRGGGGQRHQRATAIRVQEDPRPQPQGSDP